MKNIQQKSHSTCKFCLITTCGVLYNVTRHYFVCLYLFPLFLLFVSRLFPLYPRNYLAGAQCSFTRAANRSFALSPSLRFSDSDIEQRLSRADLMTMCRMSCVQKFVRDADYLFYQALVEILIPDVLRPIPS